MPRFAVTAAWVLFIFGQSTQAADPQSYKVDMTPTPDGDMTATLKATSDLITLRTSAPVGPFGLIGRARSDADRLKTVLESYGYYQSSVVITIDDLPLEDPTLGEELSARAKGADAQVKITFSIGPLYHLRNIEIQGDIPKPVKNVLGLSSGDPAVSANVLAAGDRLQTALEDEGYAFAKVDPPIAQEIPDEQVLDVSFHTVTGAKVQIGTIRIKGLKRMRESFVLRRLLVRQGEQYGASKIERARKDLLSLGVFTAVTVEPDTKPDNAGQVPITFRVRERMLHAVSVSGAYSTDLGGSTGVTWTQRDISGRADQLSLGASVIGLGGTASTGIGYDLNAKYLLPDFGHRDQTLQLGVQAINQFLQAYDQKALSFGATLTRKLSSIWSASVGITAQRERINQEGFFLRACTTATNCPPLTQTEMKTEIVVSGPDCTVPGCNPSGDIQDIFTTERLPTYYTLLAVPITLLYNTTDLSSPIEDPTHGIRASFSETPTLSFSAHNAKFFISQANIAYYLDLHDLNLNPDPGRSVLALRALAGLAAGASQFSLPPDQRFYAGGSGTVRGYRYQAVGPTFPNPSDQTKPGDPKGGTAINAGTVEFRQRIGKSLGFAVFVDAAQVSQDINPLDAGLRFGAGAGARYYTPIGPIRLDVAVPLNRQPNDDAFELYIGLGQAF
jgi:translocation and assembly module TamA